MEQESHKVPSLLSLCVGFFVRTISNNIKTHYIAPAISLISNNNNNETNNNNDDDDGEIFYGDQEIPRQSYPDHPDPMHALKAIEELNISTDLQQMILDAF